MRGRALGAARAPAAAELDRVIDEASAALAAGQRADGHWCFELEADCTIPAEHVMLGHYLDEIDAALEAKIGRYLRARQGADGGWPLFYGGEADISCSVKAYLALKLIGDDPGDAHMRRAREAILARGGAARANVFTRIALALFGQVPWRAVPTMPAEIMLLPRWFPFHMSKVSYWSRTVIAPLLVLTALKPRARNPRNIDVRELFTTPPEHERHYFARRGAVAAAFLGLDRVLRAAEPLMPGGVRARAIERAMSFTTERLNGEDGLGGIFPAMANALMAFDALGYARDHPQRATCRRAIDRLLVVGAEEAYCQPCVSPVWDTALAAHALLEAGGEDARARAAAACAWLEDRQILDGPADWRQSRPGLRAGGWAFQYRNDYYPDVDDTAVAMMALHRLAPERFAAAIARAGEWIEGVQGTGGGWGAFDVDNTYAYLDHIPFADHGALRDPPTEDVTARCIGALCQAGLGNRSDAVARALDFLRRTQQPDGSWFGRWGTNYVYGTWSVLCALNAAGIGADDPMVRRAVAWLEARQRSDGGWGEDGASYWPDRRDQVKASTASQTAWALLALMAAGEADSDAVRRGVDFLLAAPRAGARWHEDWYTAVGFPRVFYLRYHGYAAYFPLWALARYRMLTRGNAQRPAWGI
ncbi:MAG TPA: squalene--hopene cyclase [Alphaproteobacteria bacterium]